MTAHRSPPAERMGSALPTAGPRIGRGRLEAVLRNRALGCGIAIGAASAPAGASVITLNFDDSGAQAWTAQEKAAVSWARELWAFAIPDPNVASTITFVKNAIPPGAISPPSSEPRKHGSEELGNTTIEAYGANGAPLRATITIDPNHPYFVDFSPQDSNEFVRVAYPGLPAALDPNLYVNGPAGRYDLVTLAAHEIGHALGFTDAGPFNALRQRCDATRPLGDRNVCLNLGPGLIDASGADALLAMEGDGNDGPGDLSPSVGVNEIVHFQETAPATPRTFDLMSPVMEAGQRSCPSGADIWAFHRAYGYQVNLASPCVVPEPLTSMLTGVALLALAAARRRGPQRLGR